MTFSNQSQQNQNNNKMKKISYVFLLGFCYFYIDYQRAEPETFLIPKGFKGKVMVVFEKNNREKLKLEGNRRIYKIPDNGILVTQSKATTGLMNRQFYYIDSLNNRISLKDFRDSKEAKFYGEVGIFYSGTAGVYGNSGDSQSIIFNEFIVSDYKILDSFFTKDYKEQFMRNLEQVVGRNLK
jgi:hypothetical protein